MWTPKKVGTIVAQRDCEIRIPKARALKVKIFFGRPVQQRNAAATAPWFCPLEVKGLGPRGFWAITGSDSLHAFLRAVSGAEALVVGHAKWCDGSIFVNEAEVTSPLLVQSDLAISSKKKGKRP